MTRNELKIYAEQMYWKGICNLTYKDFGQLNKCQAQYLDTGSAVILRSYSNIVAIFNKEVGSLYVFDYYSLNTARHIYKFADMLDWDRIVYLYKRNDNVLEISRHYKDVSTWEVENRVWENLIKNDFSMEITNRWE